MRVIVEVILAGAEKSGIVFIEGKSPGLLREYDLILSDNRTTATAELLNFKESIREEMIHFRYKEIK